MPRSLLDLADMATPMAIRTAATLGLADCAGEDGATAEELASDTATHAPALRRLLDHLVTVGVFAVEAESGRYRPTVLGAQMREDAPQGLRPLLDINQAGGRAELAFVELLTSVTTGEPAYERRYGRGFWADLDTDPRLRRSFDNEMNWRFQLQAPQIAERYDWSRFSRILDVGGGDGTVLAAILTAHPDVHGQVLDLAPTTDAAAARFAAAGLEDRAHAAPGSFFDSLPAGFDAYLLSDIVHDWDDDNARAILTRCREAAGATGSVVLIEPIRGEGVGTGIDLFMLMCFGGRERTVDELVHLAADCGLRFCGAAPIANGRTVLEFEATSGTPAPA